MSTWSRVYAAEAVLCAGHVSLLCPLLLVIPVAVSMEPTGALLVFVVAIACVAALLAYWQLALATIDRRPYKFGWLFWFGLAGAASVVATLVMAAIGEVESIASPAGQFWLLVTSPTALSAFHFVYVQRGMKRRQSVALQQ